MSSRATRVVYTQEPLCWLFSWLLQTLRRQTWTVSSDWLLTSPLPFPVLLRQSRYSKKASLVIPWGCKLFILKVWPQSRNCRGGLHRLALHSATNMSLMQYADELHAKSCKAADVYGTCTLNNVFNERVDFSICHSLTKNRALNLQTELTDIATKPQS